MRSGRGFEGCWIYLDFYFIGEKIINYGIVIVGFRA